MVCLFDLSGSVWDVEFYVLWIVLCLVFFVLVVGVLNVGLLEGFVICRFWTFSLLVMCILVGLIVT